MTYKRFPFVHRDEIGTLRISGCVGSPTITLTSDGSPVVLNEHEAIRLLRFIEQHLKHEKKTFIVAVKTASDRTSRRTMIRASCPVEALQVAAEAIGENRRQESLTITVEPWS